MTTTELLANWGAIEADFHAVYGISNLPRELRRRTWRWFTVRLSGLPSESNLMLALYPPDPKTGERKRRRTALVLEGDVVDAFFRRQAAS